MRFPTGARSFLRRWIIKNGFHASGTCESCLTRDSSDLRLEESRLRQTTSDGAGIAIAEIEVCFRLVQACPATCVIQPSLGRFLDVRPPRRPPPQWGKRNGPTGDSSDAGPMKARGARPRLGARASSVPGIEVCSGWSKPVQVRVFVQPSLGRFF